MAIYARATMSELDAVLNGLDAEGAEEIRAPETGLVMARGRIGGSGAPFNAGEVSVTRSAFRLRSGEIGVSYQLGRDRARARTAALIDALWQTDRRAEIEARLDAIRSRIAADRALAARRTAATRVDFFTMARGED